MKRNIRFGYSPTQLFAVGLRMIDDYDADSALHDYMVIHPEADPAAVRKELDDLVRGWKTVGDLLVDHRRVDRNSRPEDAVAAYLELHPNAKELDLWDELVPQLSKRELARAEKRTHVLKAMLTPAELWDRLSGSLRTVHRRTVEIEYLIYNPNADYGVMMRALDDHEAKRRRSPPGR